MTGLRKISLAFWFMTLALPIVAQTTGKLSRTTSSSIRSARDKYGNDVIITTNRRFTFTRFYPNYSSPGYHPMVLLEEFRSEWTRGTEGKRAKIRVDGWVGDFPNPSRKAWTILSEGDEGEVHNDFYKVTRYGCCALINTQIWFNLIDGQKVFTSNIDPIQIIVTNNSVHLSRYFAWHSYDAIIPPAERQTMKDLKGVLQYGSERKVSQRLLVRSPIDLYLSKIAIRHQGKLHEDMESLVRGVFLRGADGKKDKSAISDFSVVLTWNEKFEAEIPVENDELQIGKAKVPDKIILEVAK
ncbi:MAG: hypothetical protein ACREA2_19445 [Blastocatellia bacterium]